jgi:hypothetical protein
MALGVTDHPWTIGELVDAALRASEPKPLPTPPAPFVGMSAGKAKGAKGGGVAKLYVIKGGKRGKK